ncbi:MAG: glycosyltransferase [Flaviflexus sp.]|nr:glycosyltransferase [Flaviflexus sp.]
MRVAMVTPWFPTRINPVSGTFVVKDSVAIAKAGVDLRIIHLVPSHEDDGIRKTTHEGLKVVRVPMETNNPLSILRASRRVAELCRHADILHTQAISAIEPFVFDRPNIPWVHTEHWSAMTSPQTLPPLRQLLHPLVLQMTKLPDVALGECEFLADALREVRGSRPVEVIPCQVPAPDTLVERPERTSKLRLVSTGALVERKDPLLAVRALKVLADRGKPASLTWLGGGELREEAIALAKELGVEADFPGVRPMSEVYDAIAAGDMFFAPTRGENFFVAAAEAIVNGRPIVAGCNGGHVEYIEPSVGAIVDEQTPEAYAAAIMELDDRTKDLSAREIADTVGDRFEPATIANSYLDLYRRVL